MRLLEYSYGEQRIIFDMEHMAHHLAPTLPAYWAVTTLASFNMFGIPLRLRKTTSVRLAYGWEATWKVWKIRKKGKLPVSTPDTLVPSARSRFDLYR